MFPNDLPYPALLLVYVHRVGQIRGFFVLMHSSAAGFALRLLTWPTPLAEGNPTSNSDEDSEHLRLVSHPKTRIQLF